MTDREILRRLGAGESIEGVCRAAGLERAEFDDWWRRQAEARVPESSARLTAGVSAEVRIHRDELGIPHIFAGNEADLFFGLGFAMAQDRLFQMDWLRRKGGGRLAEILGPAGVEFDLVARTVGLNRIAKEEWARLPGETREVLEWFSAGVNAVIAASRGNLPIEFDLLDYEPEEWTPLDSLRIENEFRWYLTGRFPIIVMPELARRVLGDGPLWREFCLGELDEESILPTGCYPTDRRSAEPVKGPPHLSAAARIPRSGEVRSEGVGQVMGPADDGTGSNNWVVSGGLSADGKPLLATDPHIAFEAVSCWYQVRLCGGRYHTAGIAYAGMPAVMFGRNERVAWGITNNICSLRDLYQEKTDPAHPGCFLYDGAWEPAKEATETIGVKGGAPVTRTIRISRNGPIVDEILPPPGNRTGPVSLNWLGLHQGGFLTALLAMDRAGSAAEFREALRPWHVPTFCLVFADVEGNIGMQSSGRIPIRSVEERGYRAGWDPNHQWQGLIPFEHMPGVMNPERGWMGTANHRLAPPDYPRPLYGRWVNGARGRRIREMIEERAGSPQRHTVESFRDMQQDCVSLRGKAEAPAIVAAMGAGTLLRAARSGEGPETDSGRSTERTARVSVPVALALERLAEWDGRSLPESVGATVFNVFFTFWAKRVVDERFDPAAGELLVKGIDGVASRLLHGDEHGWFRSDRLAAIRETFAKTVAHLSERFGPDASTWTWGRLHRMPLKHVLSSRGDLGALLDHGGEAVRGDMVTVCNTGSGPDWTAVSGAGYRHIAELGSSPPTLRMVDGQSASGHPGSRHYSDQFALWSSGGYHTISLERTANPEWDVTSLRPA